MEKAPSCDPLISQNVMLDGEDFVSKVHMN